MKKPMIDIFAGYLFQNHGHVGDDFNFMWTAAERSATIQFQQAEKNMLKEIKKSAITTE